MRTKAPKVFCIGLVLAVFAVLHAFSPARAATGDKKTDKQIGSVTDKIAKSESPIHIVADRMVAKQQEHTVVFEGHVIVQQDDMTLTANKLTVVSLASDNPPGNGSGDKKTSAEADADNKGDGAALADKIDYIEAEGGIKVTQQDRLATSDRAVFYQKDQKVVLYGHPIVNQGKDRIEGKLITIFLQEGRSIVDGGGKDEPVKAILFPGKKE
jgi:lipopolysaccharide export system protein LptA